MRTIFSKKAFEKYSSYISFVLILGTFIFSFYILSDIFVLNGSKPRTIVLENSLFENHFPNNYKVEIQLESVNRFDTSYSIGNFDIVNNNSLVFSTVQQNRSSLSILNISSTEIQEIDKKDIRGLKVSSDGEKLLYSFYDKVKYNPVTYLYDLQEKEIQKNFQGIVNEILPDGSRYIGILDEDLFVQDITTNERKNLISLREIAKRIESLYFNESTNFRTISIKGSGPLDTSMYGNWLYFTGFYGDSLAIYRIDLEDENSLERLITGRIGNFTALNNRKLMLQGNINGEVGLFQYNIEDKSVKTIIQGNISNFDITSDGRLAYIVQNKNGVNEVHVAYYDGDEIRSREIIYIDSKYASFLEWSRDGNHLFYVNGGLGGSEILRFNFNR